MTKKPCLYSAKGRLNVMARGYWFSGGGNKGSFGYYPHLKNEIRTPVYPDTQVKGNLKMAAKWLEKLCPENNISFSRLFGNPGKQTPSMITITDLCLTPKGCTQWSESRFQIKTRIKIDEKTKTVEPHFLAEFELAYLEGLPLSAEVFIGYFRQKEECEKAVEFLQQSASLISGFGAFRSRGYG